MPPPVVNAEEKSYQPYLAPNPASNSSILHLPEGNTTNSASLINTQGQIIQQFHIQQGQRQLVIPTDNLPVGLYFIKLNKDGIVPLKLLIQ
jgi:hypothetical protein